MIVIKALPDDSLIHRAAPSPDTPSFWTPLHVRSQEFRHQYAHAREETAKNLGAVPHNPHTLEADHYAREALADMNKCQQCRAARCRISRQ